MTSSEVLLDAENTCAADAALKASTDRALRISENRYRRLFETAKDGILLLNAETAQIEDANPFLIELLGYSHAELLGKKLWEIGAFKDASLSKEAFIELQEKGFIRYDDLPLVAKSGTVIYVEFVSNSYECEGMQVIQCNIRDNTKRHLGEIALKATTRALKIISEGNLALLKAETESILFSEYCRITVETGHYSMAWIGIDDNGDNKTIAPITLYKQDEGYSALPNSTWAESTRGNGPIARAIRSKQIQFVGDISTDQTILPWRDEAIKYGFQSCIAVPFQLPDGVMACLSLYSTKQVIWSKPECMLLQQLAADLAFGIAALQATAAKVAFQDKLRESLEQTIQVIADAGEERDAYTAEHQRRVAALCTRIAVELGLSIDRIHGLHLAASIHDLGKIGIPAEILSKPRRLSASQLALVKEHPTIGFNIIT